MNCTKSRSLLVVTSVFVLAASALVIAANLRAQENGKTAPATSTVQTPTAGSLSVPVTVTGPLPMPVTGEVGVSGPVRARQAGDWSVDVKNAYPRPLFVTNLAGSLEQLVHYSYHNLLASTYEGTILPYHTGAGSRLVEHVSVWAVVPENQSVVIGVKPGYVQLDTNPEPIPTAGQGLLLKAIKQGTKGGQDHFVASEPISMFLANYSCFGAINDRWALVIKAFRAGDAAPNGIAYMEVNVLYREIPCSYFQP